MLTSSLIAATLDNPDLRCCFDFRSDKRILRRQDQATGSLRHLPIHGLRDWVHHLDRPAKGQMARCSIFHAVCCRWKPLPYPVRSRGMEWSVLQEIVPLTLAVLIWADSVHFI